jgi:nucleoside-triphosphatase THEP1
MKSLKTAINDGDNVLLTGGAGVGKTFTMNQVIDMLKAQGHKFAVCAMTGLAAQHLSFGMTIHRFLQVGGKTKKEDIFELQEYDNFIENLDSIAHVKAIIIDEVSMMRTDFMELMHEVLMLTRKRYNITKKKVMDIKEQMPFGGYQLIFVGDFCQLPPVVPEGEKVPCKWIFQHSLFKEAQFRIYNLTEVKRTNDPVLATTLNKIRVGFYDDQTLQIISKRNEARIEGEGTVLMSRIQSVKDYNQRRLSSHDGDPVVLNGHVVIREELKGFEQMVKRLYRTVISESGLDKTITLKTGCRVMILANNPDMGYSNGSQGVLLDMKKFDELSCIFTDRQGHKHYLDYKYFGECLHVLLNDGRDIVVPKKAFPIYGSEFDDNGKRKVDATFYQYPITAGYAVSIHRAQGMSLDRMILDCSKIFADGQFYVGLSRARSLEGMSILNFHPAYVRADQDAVDFYLKIASMKQGDIYGN